MIAAIDSKKQKGPCCIWQEQKTHWQSLDVMNHLKFHVSSKVAVPKPPGKGHWNEGFSAPITWNIRLGDADMQCCISWISQNQVVPMCPYSPTRCWVQCSIKNKLRYNNWDTAGCVPSISEGQSGKQQSGKAVCTDKSWGKAGDNFVKLVRFNVSRSDPNLTKQHRKRKGLRK